MKKGPGEATRVGKEKTRKTAQTAPGEGERRLRILILEDNPADAELIERQLKKDGISCSCAVVKTRAAYQLALKNFLPDAILADYRLPRFDALQALALRNKTAPLTPFIVITGSVSEEVAVACMKQGADDYLLKDRLARLGEAIGHALAARRLQAEKSAVDAALHKAAAQWRATFDAMNEAVCLLDEKGTVLRCNRAMNSLLGLPHEKVIAKDCLELICGKTKRKTCSFRLMLKSRRRMEEETSWHGRRYHVTVDPIIVPGGKIAGAVHIMSDVTDALQAAEKLSASEKQFRDLYENATIGLYRTTPEGQITIANRALVRMLGYGSFAELAVRDLEQAGFEPEYPRRDFRERIEREGQVIGFESAWKRHDGTTIFVRESAMPIRAEDGSIRFYDGTVEDISERKRAEDSRDESEKRFAVVFHSSPISIAITRLRDNRFLNVNAAWQSITGYSLEEAIGRTPPELNLWVDLAARQRLIEALQTRGTVRDFEIQIRQKSGATASLLISAESIMAGDEPCMLTMAIDISERMRSEEMLRLTSKRLELTLDSAKAGIWDWDVRTGHIEWSPRMFSLLGLDPKSCSATFESWRSALHPGDRESAENRIGHALKERVTLDSDYRVVLPNSQLRWINAIGEGIYNDAGLPVQMIGICQDISDRKRTEEQIRASLHEKEVLLKEIHHRVKNNLQVISGLLALQAGQVDDERLQRMIKESQGRIWTMALIHQTLYQSGNLAAIDMADYIRGLAGNLLSSHAQVAMPPAVHFDLLPLQLVIDKAIPLALIINELVTNSLKHAFPDGRPGEIRITLHECRGTARRAPMDQTHIPTDNMDTTPGRGTAFQAIQYELIIADDGVGLPGGFDPALQKSLGLQLVAMLAKQLDGSLGIEGRGGTSVRVMFSADERNKRPS